MSNFGLDDLKECYQFLLKLTADAGQMVIEGFYGIKEVEFKGGKSWDLVTEYDKKTEKFLISNIKQKYPNHLFVAEEDNAEKKVKPELTEVPTWIIDPIDGTTNFVHGLPIIGISVALAINKEIVIGVVHNPVTNQQFSAIKGGGSFLNGKRIHASKVKTLDQAIIANEVSLAMIPFIRDRTLTRLNRITEVAQGVRSLGSAAMALCFVANGAFEAYFTDGLQCWDVAAGVLIIKEAGGVVYNSDGNEFDMFARHLMAAGNEDIGKAVLKLLKECDEKTKKK